MTPLTLATDISEVALLLATVSDIYGYQSLHFIYEKIQTIHILSAPSLILIAQSTAEKRHTLLLLSSFGHPVVL